MINGLFIDRSSGKCQAFVDLCGGSAQQLRALATIDLATR
jgi:hypothetical protein